MSINPRFTVEGELQHTDKNCLECDRINDGGIVLANQIELLFSGYDAKICTTAIALMNHSCRIQHPVLFAQAFSRVEEMCKNGALRMVPHSSPPQPGEV